MIQLELECSFRDENGELVSSKDVMLFDSRENISELMDYLLRDMGDFLESWNVRATEVEVREIREIDLSAEMALVDTVAE